VAAAGRAEVEMGHFALVAPVRISVRFAGNLHRLRRKPGLGGKGGAAAPLAVEAVADRDPHRLPGGGDAELAAAARCGGHFDAFLRASRTSASRVASGPSSSLAAAT